MHFKAFSSRIERRALGTIALLSILPIAVLAYAAWQETQRLTISHFENRLQTQLYGYSDNLSRQFDGLAQSLRLSDNPNVLKTLPLARFDKSATPPNPKALQQNSKPHMVHTQSRLWMAVHGDTAPTTVEIDQRQLLADLQGLYPMVEFCLSFRGAAGSDCAQNDTSDQALSLVAPVVLDSRFATNFDAWILAKASRAAVTRGSPEFIRTLLVTLLLASLIGIGASTLTNRRVLAPLKEFSRGTKALQEYDYDVELKIKTDDEFEDLGNAFNSMTEHLRASNRLTATLSQVDHLILKTNDMERVIRAVLNAIMRIEANAAWLLTFGHDTLPAERIYWVDNEGSLDSADTFDWKTEMPLIPSVDDVQPEKISEASGLNIKTTLPVLLDDHVVAVMLIGPSADSVSTEAMRAENLRHYRELTDRLSVAMTNIDRSMSLYKQANQDALTGLLNRQAFERELRQECNNVQKDNSQSALLFIDLDRFKQVNDTEGHKAGDRLLLVIARRLQQSLRPSDCIARLGGDEFAVLFRDVPQTDESAANAMLIETCERIIGRLSKPVVVERLEHSIHASIGITYINSDFVVADQLLSRADVAMYSAKTKAGCNYAFYDPSLSSESEQRIQLESRLRQALSGDDIRLHYQPQLDLLSGAVTGVEGLLRWQSELNGNVPPDRFIPVAEES